jgi:hypothetical protein
MAANVPVVPARDGPPAIPALAAPNGPMTFRELYLGMPDIYGGEYLASLNRFGPNNNRNAASTLEYAAFRMNKLVEPSVFVYLDRKNIIRSLHQIHAPREVAISSPWDNLTFAFRSDFFTQGQITHFQVPDDFFSVTGAVRVPTLATWEGEFKAADGPMGPYDAAANDVEMISSRRAIIVPHAYVTYFFNQARTPRSAWEEVGRSMIMEGREASCLLFLNFLRLANVTAVDPRIPGNLRPELQQTGAIQAPDDPDDNLYTLVARQLCTALPARQGPTGNQVINDGTCCCK